MNSKKKKSKQSESGEDAPILSEALPITKLVLNPRKETAAKGFDFVSIPQKRHSTCRTVNSSSNTSLSSSYLLDTPKRLINLKKAKL